MERTRILELMATLKLYGMRSAYDEVMASFAKAMVVVAARTTRSSRDHRLPPHAKKIHSEGGTRQTLMWR